MKKKSKNKNNVYRILSLVYVLIGVGLILFAFLTPALRTYKNDDVSYYFGTSELETTTTVLKSEIKTTTKWSFTEENDIKYIVSEGDYLKIKIAEFHGLTLSSGDTVYKSTGAVIYFVCGLVVLLSGLALESIVCYNTYVKKGKRK